MADRKLDQIGQIADSQFLHQATPIRLDAPAGK